MIPAPTPDEPYQLAPGVRSRFTVVIGLLLVAFAMFAMISSISGRAQQSFRPGQSVSDDNPYPTKIAPQRATSTSTAGTIATTGAYQSALAANPSRRGCYIVNRGATDQLLFLGAPGDATNAKSIPIAANGRFSCTGPSGLILIDQISITGTAGEPYLVVTQ